MCWLGAERVVVPERQGALPCLPHLAAAALDLGPGLGCRLALLLPLGVREVVFDDPRPFFNINTFDDLDAWRRVSDYD